MLNAFLPSDRSLVLLRRGRAVEESRELVADRQHSWHYCAVVNRSKALTRRIALAALDDQFNHAVRSLTTPDQRFADTWVLSEEIWRLKGWDPGERGLSRHTARVARR